ncbi:lytic transglycosylase domain-containing protein [Rhabdothermincola sp.]|uniref:lytic transglycosylase domain-containing protein n=1 Tax=Rhabdothermincola sp. TaxID=2820405 RepID=UPI002FE4277A
MSPELQAVDVDSAAYRRSLSRYREAEARLAEAHQRAASAEEELGSLTLAEHPLLRSLEQAERRRTDSERRLADVRAALRDLAVAGYVEGGMAALSSTGIGTSGEERHRRILVDAVTRERLRQARAHRAVMHQMDAIGVRHAAMLEDVRQRITDTTSARDAAWDDARHAQRDLDAARGPLLDHRMEAMVTGLDLPLVALDAYVRAAKRMAFERPGCALRWQALAGIGKVESGHGTYGGARVTAAGRLSQAIVGPPLDGTNGNLLIHDSDGGQLDGDSVLDRAVGPMQFIPTSWRSLGRDGDGDGRADPHNIHDAALAAANLLCGGRPLDSDDGLRAALLRYNNSERYATLVLQKVHGYDGFAFPPNPR